MNRYAASALKFFAYSVAALVILLAVAVGLLRLMLPELPAYRDEIRARAGAAIGLDVEFDGIDARWRLSGPELIFTDVTLTDPDSGDAVLAAEEVSVGGSIARMLRERRVTVGRLALTGTSVTVERLPGGGFAVQGRAAGTSGDVPGGNLPGDIRIVLEDVDFTYRDPRARGGPLEARLTSLEWSRSGGDQELEARLEPGSEIGRALRVLAERQEGRDGPATWDVNVEATDLDLGRVASILPEDWPAPAAGMADVEIWSRFGAGGLRRAGAALEVQGLQPAAAAAEVAPYDLSARLEWALNDGGWLAAVNDLRIERGDTLRPDSFLQVSAETGDGAALTALEIQSGFLAMDDVRPFAAWLPAALAAPFADYDPSGELLSLRLSLDGLPAGVPFTYSLEAELRDAGVAPHGGLPGVRGVSGSVRADESNGRLVLDAGTLVVDAPEFFAAPIAFTRADATVVWRGIGSGLTVLCDRFILEDEWLATESSFELELPDGEASSPRLDFSAEWRLTDLSRTLRYLPVRVMPELAVAWLDKALVAGRAERGSVRFEGALADFPFEEGEGVFRARTSIRDAVMRYALQWPDIEQLDAEVSIDGLRLATTENSALIMGAQMEDAYAGFDDLREGILEVRGAAVGSMADIVSFAEASPISRLFGGRLADVTASGPGRADVDLTIPVMRLEDYEVSAEVNTSDGRFSLDGFPHPLTSVSGTARVTRSGVQAEGIEAEFLDSPMRIDIRSGDEEEGIAAVAVAESRIGAAALIEKAEVPLEGRISGETDYVAEVRFPRVGAPGAPPVEITLESDLRGMEVDLPEPAHKAADAEWPLSIGVAFPATGRLAISGYYGQTAKWSMMVERDADQWALERCNIHLGPGMSALPVGRGLHLSGSLERLQLSEWLSLASGDGEAGAAGRLIRSAELTVEDLYAFGQRARSVEVALEKNPSDWLVQVDGPTVSGSLIVPTDPGSGRPLVLDMERLHLLEADPKAGNPGSPAQYPPIEARIADFRIGERTFGSVEATFARTGQGILSEDLVASADTFEFSGSAGWQVDLTDPSGQRTMLSGRLDSTDVKTTLNQLGYFPGVNAEEATVTLDLSISGPPRSEFLDELDGEVAISIRNGQLDEVEPGAGRVFGLLSVAALPRRLSLDFRDVFNRGLGFDKIEGTFRIVNGDAYTCDLSLEGSVADIGVVGRAGLAKRDYNQTALVGADVGSSLPAVGAVVGGPPAAAALLLFSQIFKKPLEELGQAYYQVSGDFDDPTIERTDARRFAATSELAGCLNQGE